MPVSAQVLGSGLPPALRALVDRHQAARAKTTTDQSLARRLHDGIGAAGADVRGLTVYVHDGAVSLYGTLASAAVREDVLAVVTRTPGVRRVVDHLRLGGV
ncbi:BON domain-containing protein [Rubrivirga sp.]|uniref:BON domain-containing protein n=1 Tax=Rubrivirga sp. TaxID=1885344 RepID=UPI003B5200AC